jgi:nicotinamidase-related amidase
MPGTAVIVVDMLNPYEHEDADALSASVERIVAPLAELASWAASDSSDAELVYVNDNHGDFAATRETIVGRALEGRRPDLIEPIVPAEDTPFLVKVRHSAFYSTPLEYLLGRLAADRVILTGQVTEQCILYSALDAYIRHFEVCVVRDAVAAIDERLGDAALQMMERNMRAEVVETARVTS